jgi:ABC-type cobalamin transport system ATPase subunit
MAINVAAVDVGLDGMADTILTRAEQLVKNESTELVDRKSHIFNLQRKLKIMKDQLDGKVFRRLRFSADVLNSSLRVLNVTLNVREKASFRRK